MRKYALIFVAAAMFAGAPALADPLSPAGQQEINASIAMQIGQLSLDRATLAAQLADAKRTIADLQKQIEAAKAKPAAPNAGGAGSPNP